MSRHYSVSSIPSQQMIYFSYRYEAHCLSNFASLVKLAESRELGSNTVLLPKMRAPNKGISVAIEWSRAWCKLKHQSFVLSPSNKTYRLDFNSLLRSHSDEAICASELRNHPGVGYFDWCRCRAFRPCICAWGAYTQRWNKYVLAWVSLELLHALNMPFRWNSSKSNQRSFVVSSRCISHWPGFILYTSRSLPIIDESKRCL